jgi:hypothetical protein
VVDVERARTFVYRDARVLERRLYAALFEHAPSEGVVAALAAYANPDGGLGHALEPDARCPQSEPLFIAFGLEVLVAVDAAPEALLRGCCDFLASLADERGAVPILAGPHLDFPHAAHWSAPEYEPELHPALGIAASLHELGFAHPWRDRATAFALNEIDRNPPDDAHVLRDAFRLLDALGDEERVPRVAAALEHARWFKRDASSKEYGVTPLQLAPTAERARELFPQELLDEHLDALETEQEVDGGWPLSWEPPSDAARLEWRGVRTVEALRTLRAYGRV